MAHTSVVLHSRRLTLLCVLQGSSLSRLWSSFAQRALNVIPRPFSMPGALSRGGPPSKAGWRLRGVRVGKSYRMMQHLHHEPLDVYEETAESKHSV